MILRKNVETQYLPSNKFSLLIVFSQFELWISLYACTQPFHKHNALYSFPLAMQWKFWLTIFPLFSNSFRFWSAFVLFILLCEQNIVCRGRGVKFHLHRNNMWYTMILWKQASDATTWEWMWMIKFLPFIFPKQFLKWIYHCGFLDKKLEFWCFVNKLLLCILFFLA